MQNPLVSVIVTSFNQPDKLRRAVESVVYQSYKNLEIIIVDDCSTDDKTDTLLDLFISRYPELVRVLKQPQNVGIPKNKNTGFRMASGEYITYLDGDDYYFENKIEEEIKIVNQNPKIEVVYSNFIIENETTTEKKVWLEDSSTYKEGNLFREIFIREFPYNTVFRYELIKRDLLNSIGFYDEDIKAYHDWDSRIRYSLNSSIKYCNNIGSVYFVNPDGIARSMKLHEHVREIEKIYWKNRPLLKKVRKEDKKAINDFWRKKLVELNGKIIPRDAIVRFKLFVKAFIAIIFLKDLKHQILLIQSLIFYKS